MNLTLIRKWHWMSAALCFSLLLLFSVTGILLHHAKEWLPKPVTSHSQSVLPVDIVQELSKIDENNKSLDRFPKFNSWLSGKMLWTGGSGRVELKNGKCVVQVGRPGLNHTLTINLSNGEVEIETVDRGWLGYLNDLHKGKSTGMVWVYLTDLFAVCCIVFSVTGLLLLQRYADSRKATWPLLLLGGILPLVIVFATS